MNARLRPVSSVSTHYLVNTGSRPFYFHLNKNFQVVPWDLRRKIITEEMQNMGKLKQKMFIFVGYSVYFLETLAVHMSTMP